MKKSRYIVGQPLTLHNRGRALALVTWQAAKLSLRHRP